MNVASRRDLHRWRALLLWLVAVQAVWSSVAHADRQQYRIPEPVFNGQLQVYEDGPRHAPVVLLVHGLGDKASRDWEGLVRLLARTYRVIRFDLPGFGHSSKSNVAYTPENYALLIQYLVERQLRVRSIRLVGHSMGGAIALRYAARFPQTVSSLVLVDVPGILHRSVYSRHLALQNMGTLIPGASQLPPDAVNNLLGNAIRIVEQKHLMPELLLQFPQARQTFLNGEPAKIAGLALALEDFSNDIATLRLPTLLIWGAQDSVAPLRTAHLLAATLPQSRLVILAGSGHVPMDDDPEQFNQVVSGFLQNPEIPMRHSVLQEPLTPVTSKRTASCRKRDGATYEGEYEQLDIFGCRNVIIRGARIQRLRIYGAEVSIEDSRIGGNQGGLLADDARVVITGSRIEGHTAITLAESKLDVAGSRIVGEQAAILARSTSDVIFSVTRVESPHTFGNQHGLRVVTAQTPL